MGAVEALSRYYGVHTVWLGAPTRATVERIVRGLTDHNARMFETLDKDQRERQEAGKDAKRWHDDELHKLIADVQTRPRWQRLIGG